METANAANIKSQMPMAISRLLKISIRLYASVFVAVNMGYLCLWECCIRAMGKSLIELAAVMTRGVQPKGLKLNPCIIEMWVEG